MCALTVYRDSLTQLPTCVCVCIAIPRAAAAISDCTYLFHFILLPFCLCPGIRLYSYRQRATSAHKAQQIYTIINIYFNVLFLFSIDGVCCCCFFSALFIAALIKSTILMIFFYCFFFHSFAACLVYCISFTPFSIYFHVWLLLICLFLVCFVSISRTLCRLWSLVALVSVPIYRERYCIFSCRFFFALSTCIYRALLLISFWHF